MTRHKNMYQQPGVGRAPTSGKLDTRIEKFKKVYVHERRLIEQLQKGGNANYKPPASLDGISRFDTPEARTAVNEWQKAYANLHAKFPELEPVSYIRVLFKILRGSSLATPPIQQVSNIKYLDLVRDYIKNQKKQLLSEFRSEVQRANTAIVIHEKGSGHPFSLSVYYALLDVSLNLSPMFKYCLAEMTIRDLRAKKKLDRHCEKLQKLATQWELLAALDYTVFAADYDEIWGVTIPKEFKSKAFHILELALDS